MVGTESKKSRRDLTRRFVDGHLSEDKDLKLEEVTKTKFVINLGDERLISYDVTKGVIRSYLHYQFLPKNVRNLVDSLEGIGYRRELL